MPADAPLGEADLADMARRRDPADVDRLIAEVRRLARLADERADEILRLSRLLDDDRRASTSDRSSA